jgi:hypothetical protein
MRVRYLRNEPGNKESLAAVVVAGTVAAGAGLITFYFARLLLSREAVGEPDERELLSSPSAEN